MATSSFLEDAKNQNQTTTEINAVTPNDHPFSWINTWIIYCPMITNTTIKNSKIINRHKLIYKIAFISIILICIFFWMWDVIIEFHDYGFSLFTLVWCISISFMNIARLISVYYFYNYFQFYTTHNNKNDIEMQNNNEKMKPFPNSSGFTIPQYHSLTKKFSRRMKIILILAILCLLGVNISSTVQILSENPKSKTIVIYEIFYNFFAIYFYDIPLFLAQFILSIYYCEGCIFVKSLIEIIDKSIKIDFEQLIKEYSLYRNEFKKKIGLLEYMIIFRLCSLISFVWVNITGISEAKTWLEATDDSLWLFIGIFPFFEIIMAGNAATRKFHSFKKKLYSVGIQNGFFTDATMYHSNSQYLFLLDYVSTFPFLIKIFAKEVSLKNALKIITVFVVAKMVTYLFKHNLV
eukprot:280166_1